MNDKNSISRLSKKLSHLLRHGAHEARIAMDAAGWVSVPEVLAAIRIDRPTLELVVRENNKSRLEYDGQRVRACQGHSLAGTPVTLEALEASWERLDGDATVFHGTSIAAVEGIAREGILAGARTHVHLAAALDSAVGKRAGVDVVLEVSPELLRKHGYALFKSPNGVVLARHVPADCVVALEPMTARARADAARLNALFRPR